MARLNRRTFLQTNAALVASAMAGKAAGAGRGGLWEGAVRRAQINGETRPDHYWAKPSSGYRAICVAREVRGPHGRAAGAPKGGRPGFLGMRHRRPRSAAHRGVLGPGAGVRWFRSSLHAHRRRTSKRRLCGSVQHGAGPVPRLHGQLSRRGRTVPSVGQFGGSPCRCRARRRLGQRLPHQSCGRLPGRGGADRRRALHGSRLRPYDAAHLLAGGGPVQSARARRRKGGVGRRDLRRHRHPAACRADHSDLGMEGLGAITACPRVCSTGRCWRPAA